MITIKSPVNKEEFKRYYALRYHVLRESFGYPRGTEKDDYEPISRHFMAVDDQTGEIVGVVKIFEKEPGIGQFSHMAVSENHQREGIGRMLMQAVEQAAREHGYRTLGIMTRVNATSFYEKFGFTLTGLPSLKSGNFTMVWMEKPLS